jgi:pimeloyl-ACP methyl ester carboxylesterase
LPTQITGKEKSGKEDKEGRVGFGSCTLSMSRGRVAVFYTFIDSGTPPVSFSKGLSDYWEERSEKNAQVLLDWLLTIEGTKWHYLHGVSDPSKISPDNWVIDQAYQDRPGNKDIQLSILYYAKRDLDVFDDWQQYFRKQQPPTLITWGKNDGIFTVEGAELFKRDIPSAELHLLDTGHFALEEEVDRIGSLMHEFLDRTINKK